MRTQPATRMIPLVAGCLTLNTTGDSAVRTTNRRLWEHDLEFLDRLKRNTCIGIDMETATLFIVGHYNRISRGALLLVSDVPITPEGVKTEESDAAVTESWSDIHLQIGIEAMTEIDDSGEAIRHFRY